MNDKPYVKKPHINLSFEQLAIRDYYPICAYREACSQDQFGCYVSSQWTAEFSYFYAHWNIMYINMEELKIVKSYPLVNFFYNLLWRGRSFHITACDHFFNASGRIVWLVQAMVLVKLLKFLISISFSTDKCMVRHGEVRKESCERKSRDTLPCCHILSFIPSESFIIH